MCFALYLCSDRKLEEINSSDKYEYISVYGLNCEYFSEVLDVEIQFKKRYLYSVNGYCACDFKHLVLSNLAEDSKERFEYKIDIVQNFFKYLNDQLVEGEQVEIYYCWMGDESKPRKSGLDTEINLKNLDFKKEIGFKDRQYILVTK